MYKSNILTLFILLMCFCSCKDTKSSETNTETSATENPTAAEAVPVEKEVTVYAWVDNLRMRAEPSTKSEIVTTIREGEPLHFLDEKTDFTEKINLRGTLFEEPWLKVKTKTGEEGWVFGGAVKFYKPKIDNSPSPYDACFKYKDRNKRSSCMSTIQKTQVNKDRLRVKQFDDGFTFILLNGSKHELRDTSGNYQYMNYIKEMGYFVVRKGTDEGGYLLINDKNGSQVETWGYPKPAPDNKSVAIAGNGFGRNGVQVFSFTDSGFRKVFEEVLTDQEPGLPKWVDASNIALELAPLSGDAKRATMEIAKASDGSWTKK